MKWYLFVPLLAMTFFLACEDPADVPGSSGLEERHLRDGITRLSDDSLAFVLFAPHKQSVYLIGDFNDWTASEAYRMQKDGNRFWIAIGDLDPTKEYICQYLIDNRLRIADPYANKISDPAYDAEIPAAIYPDLIAYPTGKTSEIAMVVSTRQENYNWNISNYTVENPSSLVIYELLIRDFTEQRSIQGVKAKLPYLKSLGVNAIELMPFNEFEGNDSWGYNPSFYFATDKAYGRPNDYKEFIDACHANGMAVIMDMVLNHSYGQSPMVRMYQQVNGNPSSENPWYNMTSPNQTYSWGYDFNQESPYTQAFVDSVCAYWMQEYKIDGFRFDFTKGFTNTPGDGWDYDASRIAILKRMAGEVWKRKPDALVICEHLADNREERELTDSGILLWGNMNYNTNEATMGWGEELDNGAYKGNLTWASYKSRGWTTPNLVVYMESHDEERLMYKNEQWGKDYDGYNVKDTAVGLQRTAAAAVIVFSIPGPKMMWQFGELGYDYKLGSSMEEGRLDKKPIRWDYYDNPRRKALHDVYARMIDFRTSNTLFSTTDFSIDLSKHFKTVTLRENGATAVAMANFDVVPQTKAVAFGVAGEWQEAFSGQSLTTTAATDSITLAAGEYRLYFSR
jgi:1,4-alpha-glucan branching enzyme